MTLNYVTTVFAYASGTVAAVLSGILVWQWTVSTLAVFLRRGAIDSYEQEPLNSYEELRERALEPINPPPRCYACGRRFIWPDNEPVPPKQRCLECSHKLRETLFWLAVVATLGAMVAAIFSR
jgi:hypothetical protein